MRLKCGCKQAVSSVLLGLVVLILDVDICVF